MPLKSSPLDCDAWDWCIRKERFAIRVPSFLFKYHRGDRRGAFIGIKLEPIPELLDWLSSLHDEHDQYRVQYPPLPQIVANVYNYQGVPFWISFKREHDLLMFRIRFYGTD